MSYRKDIVSIIDEIESDLQDICSDLDTIDIEGIDEIDNVKEKIDLLLKKLY